MATPLLHHIVDRISIEGNTYIYEVRHSKLLLECHRPIKLHSLNGSVCFCIECKANSAASTVGLVEGELQ